MTSLVVENDRIKLIEAERYIAGSKGVYRVEIRFSGIWKKLNKTLIFKTDHGETCVDVNSHYEEFTIPDSVFAKPSNTFQVGVKGVVTECDEVVLVTRWLSLGRILPGASNDDCCCDDSEHMVSPHTYKAIKSLIDRKADRLTYEDGQFNLWSGDRLLSSFPAPVALPAGGTAGQVLAKASDEENDYEWITVKGGGATLTAPIGGIVAWSGSVDDVPEGWSLCDGQNGTIDLRHSFIIGAADYSNPESVYYVDLTYTEEDDDTTRVYALAFIQKTSITAQDKKIGASAYEIAVADGFEGSEREWLESLKGAPGKSAYEIAVDAGYSGSVSDWLESLKSYELPICESVIIDSNSKMPSVFGDYIFKDVTLRTANHQGVPLKSFVFTANIVNFSSSNINQFVFTLVNNLNYTATCDENGDIIDILETMPGSSDGSVVAGPKGDDGESAYQIAVRNGYQGDEQQWLESLKGSSGHDGKSAYDIAKEHNPDLVDEKQWLASLKGENGKSAYDIAKQFNPLITDEAEWLESLKGQDGESGKDGKSAYEIAKDYNFVGSEEDWLASLVGERGEDGKSVQMIQEYSTDGEVIIGRWFDGKPVKRKVYTFNQIDVDSAGAKAISQITQDLTIVNLSAIATFENGDIIPSGISGKFTAQLPTIYDDVWFCMRYYPNERDQNLYLYTNGVISSTIALRLTVVIEYVNPNDAELSDDDLIVDTEGTGSGSGTSDHRQLINRDALQQHPISAITDLTANLSARPSKAIDNSEIDKLFE